MQLSQSVISELERLNENRGAKMHPYSWEHLKETGYRGNFYKYVPGKTPVMKAGECLDFMSLLYCLMLHEDAE